MAERVGFEPTCRLPDKPLSRRPRYDHFGTSPQRQDDARCRRHLRLSVRRRSVLNRLGGRDWKNRCITARHSASSTAGLTSTRWFSAG